MTDLEHDILELLRKGPKPLSELWQQFGATMTAEQIDRALDALLDGKKVVSLVAVGLYTLGVGT